MNDFLNYLNNGVEKIVKDILKMFIKNPKISLYILKLKKNCEKEMEMRNLAEKSDEHIPPFIIASITKQCNLDYKGCYSKYINKMKTEKEQLSAKEWNKIFLEAENLGINFIILTGGEPFCNVKF